MKNQKITHSYRGLGREYLKARRGSPRFAEFLVSHAGLDERIINPPLTIVELGAGSGQQTEYVEKELRAKGITRYKILAFDKSQRLNPDEPAGQLDILRDRIESNEISNQVIPVHLDFDENALPLESESVDLVYMGHVFHHLLKKEKVLKEIVRILRKNSRLFILGVTLEDMVNHPLDEFFPTKYEYEVGRYPAEKRMIKLFESAGLTYEQPFRTGRHNERTIDRDFLASVENTTQDSVFKIIQKEDPAAFREGVARVRREVEKGEASGKYRTFRSAGRLRVFWGIKH
jgi:ubiquinone/menaquinone biosynthesis C-methylase UbiE